MILFTIFHGSKKEKMDFSTSSLVGCQIALAVIQLAHDSINVCLVEQPLGSGLSNGSIVTPNLSRTCYQRSDEPSSSMVANDDETLGGDEVLFKSVGMVLVSQEARLYLADAACGALKTLKAFVSVESAVGEVEGIVHFGAAHFTNNNHCVSFRSVALADRFIMRDNDVLVRHFTISSQLDFNFSLFTIFYVSMRI